MAELLIVDGYNIINASKRWKSLSIEQARDELCSVLYDYCSFLDYELIVVFDAHMQKTPRNIDEFHDACVVYTAAGETADNYIERTVRLLYAPGLNITVATSDGVEQVMVMGYARRMSARELLEDIRRTRKNYRGKFVGGKDTGYNRSNTLENRISPEHKQVFERLRRGLDAVDD